MSNNKNVNINSNNNNNVIETGGILCSDDDDDKKLKCEKCGRSFSSAQSLKTHSLTTNCVKEVVSLSHRCEFCSKDFSSKQMMCYHQNNCVEKKIHHLTVDYEAKIKLLEDKISLLLKTDYPSP
jgi:hypothetical protein